MDIFSHALWGATIIRKKELIPWALFLGAAPDLLGSGPAFFYLLFNNLLQEKKLWAVLPDFLRSNYSFWHSLLGIFLVFLLILMVKRKYWFLTFPYLFHVFLDFFTHEIDILARLFFPFVKYNPLRVMGFNWWEHKTIIFINFFLLIGINLIIWYKNKKRAVV